MVSQQFSIHAVIITTGYTCIIYNIIGYRDTSIRIRNKTEGRGSVCQCGSVGLHVVRSTSCTIKLAKI